MDTSLLFVPLTLLAGGLLAVQASANAQLSRATGSPLAASAVQLAVGLGLLTTAAAAAGALGVLAPLPHVVWWQWFGGLASALYVTSAIVLFPRLGTVVTVGLFIAGQMLASLLLDGGGLIGVEREPIGAGDGLGLAGLRSVPWWGWLGGLCGAVYVTSVFTAIPAIGAATAVGLTVAGQQLASVLFDRYGLMRLPRRAVTAPRLAGVALLLLAVVLIQAK
jgi:bacterial/archaeal transporter family-2 protein